MAAHMLKWFEDHQVPADRRLSTLTLKMMGDRLGCEIGGEPHPGCALKVKAAETGSLLPWSLAVLDQWGARVHCAGQLLTASRALERWLEITRTGGRVLSPALSQELRDCCQRCLVNCSRAGVSFTPKHHFFAHLSMDASNKGNPKLYSCFLDESLNLVL
eukprot:9584787-Lingulodinium_polyedra.AAC.1